MFYACDTDVGSSGAPVFKVVNEELKLVALHRAYWGVNNFNFGTLITKVIEHIKNGGLPACESIINCISCSLNLFMMLP